MAWSFQRKDVHVQPKYAMPSKDFNAQETLSRQRLERCCPCALRPSGSEDSPCSCARCFGKAGKLLLDSLPPSAVIPPLLNRTRAQRYALLRYNVLTHQGIVKLVVASPPSLALLLGFPA